jgi:hypothetical protein
LSDAHDPGFAFDPVASGLVLCLADGNQLQGDFEPLVNEETSNRA